MTNPNFLILDEPTNDFDIFTMNVLEKFLEQYQGCLLVVSHDRYFMDKVADTLFVLEEDGNISGFVGKCSEYIEYREEKLREKELQDREEKRKLQATGAASGAVQSSGQTDTGSIQAQTFPAENSFPKRKRTFKEQKEFEAIEEEIMVLEEKKGELEALMSGGGKVDYEAVNREYAEVTGELERKYARWEFLASLS